VQQILQQVDYRLRLLDAAQREERRLQKAQDEDRRRELTRAALEALKAVQHHAASHTRIDPQDHPIPHRIA
jgi:hypothetical protein